MAETPSNMLPLGTIASDFSLMDTGSQTIKTLQELKSDVATVILFICNHCPYVKHINSKLVEVAKNFQKKNISFIAINSNDVLRYPADSPENMRKTAQEEGYTFPYLYDETQNVARAYQAACTPDFYVFDKNLACVYRGRFDESTPGNGKEVTGKDLVEALDAILNGNSVREEQRPSVGCNIKWR